MAIIKFGPLVVDARGTIAGTIFSANKGGPFARAWSRSSNPASALQTAQRGRMGALAAAWRDLTQVQRDDWIDYADDPAQELTNPLGETYFASGFNWYVRINGHLEAAGAARRNDAPTLVRPIAPTIQSGLTFLRTTAGAGLSRVGFFVASPNIGFEHFVTTRITLQGSTAVASGFQFTIHAVPNASRLILYQDELETIYGTIVLGQREFIRVVTQDSQGQRSPLDSIFKDAVT